MALNRREQRVIIFGSVVALCVIGYLFVVEPLRSQIIRDRELIPARERSLIKAQQLIGQKEALAQDLQEISKTIEKAKHKLLPGSTPALAASELQKRVKDLSATSDVEVRSERVLPTAERGELLEIPVEITVSSSIRELTTLLHRLQETENYLTLSDVKVRVISVGQPKELLTTLTISGYILASSQPQKTGDKVSTAPKG
jgi:hypothetical protein